jgi:antitoxin (DNA-binding transcriptional repressor) of toxin-antitoxin stability system
MNTRILTVTEVVRNFSDYINRIAYKGERFVLVKGNKPVAEMKPLPAGKTLGDLPRLLASMPSLSKDELAVFSTDVAMVRETAPKEGLKDPWES